MATTDQTRVRNAVGRSPKTLEQICAVTRLGPDRASAALKKLVARDVLRRNDGAYLKAHHPRS